MTGRFASFGWAAVALLVLMPTSAWPQSVATAETKTEATKTEAKAEAGNQPAEAQGAEDGLVVRYEDTRLSADIDSKPLPEVIAALSQEMPLKVYVKDTAQEELSGEVIFARFEDQPLQTGLRYLFGDLDFLFKYGSGPSEPGEDAPAQEAMEIWFYGGTGAYREFAADGEPSTIDPPSILASLEAGREQINLSELSEEELRDLARNASSEELRALTLIELGNRVENPDNVDAFVASLEDDESKDVRWRALTQILGVRNDVPEHVYRRVINEDPSPFLRKQALAVLVFKRRHEALGVLAEVRDGRDETMSAYAQELLDWLAQQEQPPEPE